MFCCLCKDNNAPGEIKLYRRLVLIYCNKYSYINGKTLLTDTNMNAIFTETVHGPFSTSNPHPFVLKEFKPFMGYGTQSNARASVFRPLYKSNEQQVEHVIRDTMLQQRVRYHIDRLNGMLMGQPALAWSKGKYYSVIIDKVGWNSVRGYCAKVKFDDLSFGMVPIKHLHGGTSRGKIRPDRRVCT